MEGSLETLTAVTVESLSPHWGRSELEMEARRRLRLRRGREAEAEREEGSWVWAGVSGWMVSTVFEGLGVVLVGAISR